VLSEVRFNNEVDVIVADGVNIGKAGCLIIDGGVMTW
jgi:hypothetical protein